jgi:hypothetical protein
MRDVLQQDTTIALCQHLHAAEETVSRQVVQPILRMKKRRWCSLLAAAAAAAGTCHMYAHLSILTPGTS